MNRILPIVEGAGDMKAVPVLLRHLINDHGLHDTELLHPHKRGELPKVSANFDNYFRMALKENAAILLILDFDCNFCNCPYQEAEKLYSRAQIIYKDWPFKVAFVVKEFETFFLAEKHAASAVLNLPQNIQFPDDPEAPRDAKGWLSSALPKGISYKPTVHQEKITAKLNLSILRKHSPSFHHLEKSFLHLIQSTAPHTTNL